VSCVGCVYKQELHQLQKGYVVLMLKDFSVEIGVVLDFEDKLVPTHKQASTYMVWVGRVDEEAFPYIGDRWLSVHLKESKNLVQCYDRNTVLGAELDWDYVKTAPRKGIDRERAPNCHAMLRSGGKTSVTGMYAKIGGAGGAGGAAACVCTSHTHAQEHKTQKNFSLSLHTSTCQRMHTSAHTCTA